MQWLVNWQQGSKGSKGVALMMTVNLWIIPNKAMHVELSGSWGFAFDLLIMVDIDLVYGLCFRFELIIVYQTVWICFAYLNLCECMLV